MTSQILPAHVDLVELDVATRGVDTYAGGQQQVALDEATRDVPTPEDDNTFQLGVATRDVDLVVDPTLVLAERAGYFQCAVHATCILDQLTEIDTDAVPRQTLSALRLSAEGGGDVENPLQRHILRPVARDDAREIVSVLLGVGVVGDDALPAGRERALEELLGEAVQIGDLLRPGTMLGDGCPQERLVQRVAELRQIEPVLVGSLDRMTGEGMDEGTVVDAQSTIQRDRSPSTELVLRCGELVVQMDDVIQSEIDVDPALGSRDNPEALGSLRRSLYPVVRLDVRSKVRVAARVRDQGFQQLTQIHLVRGLVEHNLEGLLRRDRDEIELLEEPTQSLDDRHAGGVVVGRVGQERQQVGGHFRRVGGFGADLDSGEFTPGVFQPADDVLGQRGVLRRDDEDLGKRDAAGGHEESILPMSNVT